jgi:hypothetical protein
MNTTKCAISAIILGLLVIPPAHAEDYSMLNDPWRIYIGAFDATVDTTIGINGDVLPPVPPIDVEDVLGVEDGKTVAWGGVRWRFAERHGVELEAFTLRRSGSRSDTFSPPEQIGDSFIEAGEIATEYDTDIIRLTYAYSAFRSERSDLQLKAGLHVARLTANLNLAGAICTPNTVPTEPPGCPVAGTSNESEDVSAPLPHLGASWGYAMTPNTAFRVTGVGFAIELDNIDGSLIEIDADIAWQPWRNFGFGLGYRYFKGDVDSTGTKLNGSFEFEYHGPQVYIQTTF